MRLAEVLLPLVLALATVFAAEESCVGRCNNFNSLTKCQCDSMCTYYGSCCVDFNTACPRKIARGDTFHDLDTDTVATTIASPLLVEPMNTTIAPTYPTLPPTTTTHAPTRPPDPDAVPCSGRSFDAFMQLKNGSIFAFRGDYFFEIDERAVVPGYPKLIKDVWGMSGPIDAAFTRNNCQGKSYIFKGNKYWRYEDDVLEDDYPRDIAVGFEKMPDDFDAAFAIPSPGHHGKEKVYFFKGDQYYQYEFKHQPTHEECVRMSKSSPSVLFTRYTNLYCDNTWEDLFTHLFQGLDHKKGPRFISKDWVGIKSPVDAVMAGRIYINPIATPSPPPPATRRRSNRRRKQNRKRGRKGRKSRSLFFEDFLDDALYDWLVDGDYDYTEPEYSDYVTTTQDKTVPVQNVYIFKKDKYYRVDLATKRIDFANPPYPRSIAKYWLGCKHPTSLEEKR